MMITRRIRNRWLRLGIILSMVAVLGFGIRYLYQNYVPEDWMLSSSRDAGLVLEQVRLTGTVRTNRQEILDILDVEDGVPLIDIDIATLKSKVEAIDWVKEARIARVFPNEISVEIIEREPFALWQLAGFVQLIDKEGHVITHEGLEEFADLLLLVGEGADKEGPILKQIIETAEELSPRVASAVRMGERRWDVIMDNGIRVKLPAEEEGYGPREAWQTLEAYEQAEKILDRELLVIDLRIKDRLVVRLSPEGQEAVKNKTKQYGA